MHGNRPSSEYLRQRLKLIPAVPPPAKRAQQAHHQVFYKQKQCPVVLFHRLTLNTPPLCALFVSNNAPIQQQHYKSERHHKKRHNSSKFSGLSCSIYIVFVCFSLPPFASLAGPLAVLLPSQTAVPVKVSDFITALIREVAFNIASLITSRPSTEHIACSLCREAEARPDEAPLSAPGPRPSLKPPSLPHIQGRVHYSTTHSSGFAATTFKGWQWCNVVSTDHLQCTATTFSPSLQIEFQRYIFGYHINIRLGISVFEVC